MATIDNIHDNFFRKVFSEAANVETFLKAKLPKALYQQLDFAALALDPTSYISEAYKESLSDVVVKCRTKADDTAVDIYILFEHKSYQDKKVLLQLLRYMHLMWEKDSDEKKPLRVIIPLVFYHGKDPWQIPTRFARQFPVADEAKRFLLDFEYVLFDTNQWDWEAEISQPLKEIIFLLSAMLLMKAAFQQNLEILRQVFQLWGQMGFVHEKERISFLMIYIVETQDIPAQELTKMLEETQIAGEVTMPTLAQRLRDEGKEQGMHQGMQQGHLLGKQEDLIMLLATRFQLTELEQQLIREIKDADKLNIALKMVITAETKENVLGVLRNGAPS
jgi:predicted transposase/invertase (TIGR01784 family)